MPGIPKFRLAALGTSLLATATLALAGTPVTQLAQASASTSFSGHIIKDDSGTRVAGAHVYLYRYGSSGWSSIASRTADANGYYAFSGAADSQYYAIRGYKTYGTCLAIGYYSIYDGWSGTRFATGTPQGANVRIAFQGNVYC